jgi:adenosylcobyric acid synthase
MNPVLLKPEADTRSQVVVRGRVRDDLCALGWRERSGVLADIARDAYEALARSYDLLIIEGAGSPAETNLADDDYVNLGTARWSKARCLLVSDIDRGGSFAHLYGTQALMPADVRSQLAGYVLNRFRGDPGLLAPAPADLQRLTGVPTVAVIPYVHEHGLPEEDALPAARTGRAGPQVVVIAGPAASNLDEFECLASAGIALTFVRHAAAISPADVVILPGSKQTRVDLKWLRQTGIAEAIIAHARRGGAVIGICGGLQLLGHSLEDPDGREGVGAGRVPGLGLLSTTTAFGSEKLLKRTVATISGADGVWAALNGLQPDGYEIHIGRTHAAEGARAVVYDREGTALGWQQGSVLGLYMHGLFEHPAVMKALFDRSVLSVEEVFDRLADVVSAGFRPGFLEQLAEKVLRNER